MTILVHVRLLADSYILLTYLLISRVLLPYNGQSIIGSLLTNTGWPVCT